MFEWSEEHELMRWAEDGGSDPALACRRVRAVTSGPSLTDVITTPRGPVYFRTAEQDDAWRISAVCLRTLWECNDEYPDDERAAFSRHLTATHCEQLLKESYTVVGHLATGIVVATGSVLPGGYLSRLFVLPEVQRRGVGQSVLERLEANAESAGCKRVHLNASLSAVGYYRKRGYRGGERIYRPDFGASVRMVKRIA